MPLALKNRVKNIVGSKNQEKSCTKGKLEILAMNLMLYNLRKHFPLVPFRLINNSFLFFE